MALKDWKKTSKDEWVKRSIGSIIFIERDSITKKYKVVVAKGLAPSQQRYLKIYKTKSKALIFARRYMRTH